MKILLKVDSRKRITLPKETNIKSGDVLSFEVLETGQIMLTPVEIIPKRLIKAGVFTETNESVQIIIKKD